MSGYGYVFPLVIGLSLVTWSAVRFAPFIKAKKWKRTNALLEKVEKECSQVVGAYEAIPYCYPVVKFRYVVAGREYMATRVSFEKRNVWRPEIEALTPERPPEWSSWKSGAVVCAFYNPRRPEEAVLVPFPSKKLRSHYAAIFLGGLLCIGCGGFLASIGV